METLDLYGYDAMPYPSAPYPYSHPDHLATLAQLFGLATQDVSSARVLEIGCADGANLIPMAAASPEGHFVGIDLSARQIGAGQQAIEELGLSNIHLLQQNLDDWKTDESFDYIIAHGFYSWTPRETRDQLLKFCREHLRSTGIVFVSYNVLPGWQDRLVIRQWLQSELIGTQLSEADRMANVQMLLQRLERMLQSSTTSRDAELAKEVRQLLQWSPAYLRHDLLEDFNEPVTVSQFLEHIGMHGLQFVAEADLATMVGTDLPREMARGFASIGRSLRSREQLIDLLTRRPFRQSLLCLAGNALSSQLQPARVATLFAVSMLRPTEPCAMEEIANRLATNGSMTFVAKNGFRLTVRDPRQATVLLRLSEIWPMGEQVRKLWEQTAWLIASTGADTKSPKSEDEVGLDALCALLLAAFLERTLELHTLRPRVEGHAGQFPTTTRLVRWQVMRQEWVTNMRHDVVPLDPILKQLLPWLDGRHDRSQIGDALRRTDPSIDDAFLEKQWIRCARLGLLQSESAS